MINNITGRTSEDISKDIVIVANKLNELAKECKLVFDMSKSYDLNSMSEDLMRMEKDYLLKKISDSGEC